MDLSLDQLSMDYGPPVNGGGSAQPQMPMQPSVQEQHQPQQQLLGVLIPGRPVRTDFLPVDGSGLKYALTLSCPGDLAPPLVLVREIVLFLLPGISLPPNHGALCYVQLTSIAPPATQTMSGEGSISTGYELLGAITSDQPSASLQTGWSEKEELLANQELAFSITIALSIEPTANLQNLGVSPGNSSSPNGSSEGRLFVAQQIAYDLFHFMQSFDTGGGGPGNMVVPQNIFDRWFKRFENRFKRDPNFFMKRRDGN